MALYRDHVLEHRTWIETVFHVVRYLVLNGLPSRGDYENSNFQSGAAEGGVYLSPFTDLLFKANQK